MAEHEYKRHPMGMRDKEITVIKYKAIHNCKVKLQVGDLLPGSFYHPLQLGSVLLRHPTTATSYSSYPAQKHDW